MEPEKKTKSVPKQAFKKFTKKDKSKWSKITVEHIPNPSKTTDTTKKPRRKFDNSRKAKVRKNCFHIGGRFAGQPGGRKNPFCRECPDHPLNKGLKPGDDI